MATGIVGVFFVISYFVFVKDVLQGPVVVFPTPPGENLNAAGAPFKDKEKTAWVWQSPLTLKDDEWRQYLDFSRKENITTLYLDITDYTDMFEQIDITKRERDITALTEALRNKVRIANEYSIEIEGLAGQNHWGNSSHWYLPLELISFVQKYNNSSKPEEKLAGIQFDIEPAEHPDFELSSSQKELMMTEFLALIEGISKRIASESPDMRIGFVIPVWFDGSSDRIQNISYNKSTKSPAEHVFDALSQAPLGYVVLLDYSNHASKEGGSIEHARNEFDYVQRAQLKIPIILGQEFSPIDEKPATYYGMKKDEAVREVDALRSAYEPNPNFLGVAFHDLAYYRLLMES